MSEFVLGIDASLTSTGWSIIDRETLNVVDVGRIQTSTKMGDDDERIAFIIDSLLEIKEKYRVTDVGLEDGFVQRNKRVGLVLAKLRGGVTFVLRVTGATVCSMQPSEVKLHFMGEGKGNTKKEEVAQVILEHYPENQLVQGLGEFDDSQSKKKNSDMYDAISIGVARVLKWRKGTSAHPG